MAKHAQSDRIVTGEGRASYAFLFVPQANNKGVKQYRLTLLLPKSNPAEIKRLKGIAMAVGVEEFGATFADRVRGGQLKWPFRDGDLTHPGDPVYAGHWYISMRNSEDRKPQIVDHNRQEILAPSEFGSGDYCRLSGRFFAFDNESKGVSFSLGNVQKTRSGERIDSTVDAKAEFDALPGGDNGSDDASGSDGFDL